MNMPGSTYRRASHTVQVLIKLLLTFPEVLLVKASQLDTPRASGGGEYTRTGLLRHIKYHCTTSPHKISKLYMVVFSLKTTELSHV